MILHEKSSPGPKEDASYFISKHLLRKGLDGSNNSETSISTNKSIHLLQSKHFFVEKLYKLDRIYSKITIDYKKIKWNINSILKEYEDYML